MLQPCRHLLANPLAAEASRTPLIEAAQRHEADILITANIGDALHVAAGLRARDRHTEVLHPFLPARAPIVLPITRAARINTRECAADWHIDLVYLHRHAHTPIHPS